jgi:hypothetical protein
MDVHSVVWQRKFETRVMLQNINFVYPNILTPFPVSRGKKLTHKTDLLQKKTVSRSVTYEISNLSLTRQFIIVFTKPTTGPYSEPNNIVLVQKSSF